MEQIKNRTGRLLGTPTGAMVKKVCLQAGHFLLSLLFGGISFAGGLSPFAVGFLGGVGTDYIIASALGAASGYVVFFGPSEALRLVGAVVIITILKLFIQPKTTESYKAPVIAGITGVGAFAVSLCIYLADPRDGSFLFMVFSESLIASAFALFSSRVTDIIRDRRKSIFCNPSDTASVFFTASCVLLALERFSFYGFSAARMIGFLALLILSLYGGQTAAAITGICCGLTLGFNDTQPQLTFTFILSGIMTGITGSYGRIPVAISLVLSSALTLILKGNPDTALIALTEAIIPSVIFVLIPKKFLSVFSDFLSPLKNDFSGEERIRSLQFMLKRTGKAIKDISGSVGAVSAFLEKSDKPDYKDIPSAVREDVCKVCNKYDFCWNKCRDISEKAFREAAETLAKNEIIISEDLPERLTLICRMPDKVASGFNKAYLEMNARILARNDIFEAKKAAANQFSCIGTLIDEAADSIGTLPPVNPSAALALTPVFSSMGFDITGITEYEAPSGKSCLQVYCNRVPVIPDKTQLLEAVYEATGKEYLPPVIDEYTENGTILSFAEEGKFRISCHTASHTGAGEQFSGDTLRSFYDGQGYFYVVLSDGMGTGTRAAIDSVMTANLTARLLRAGFSPENALKTVNCALLIKSAEETLSTLDILKIDLETGKAVFYKAGAGFSAIGKADKTIIVEKSSMPLGILESTSFEKSEIDLSSGDTVIIMSDGANVIPHKQFKELIKNYRNEGMKALSEAIVKDALTHSISGRHDDITVCAVRIK